MIFSIWQDLFIILSCNSLGMVSFSFPIILIRLFWSLYPLGLTSGYSQKSFLLPTLSCVWVTFSCFFACVIIFFLNWTFWIMHCKQFGVHILSRPLCNACCYFFICLMTFLVWFREIPPHHPPLQFELWCLYSEVLPQACVFWA